MDLESVLLTLNGPQVAKFIVAAILLLAFAFWQRKEAEGVMRGYIIVALFALLRDSVFVFFPDPNLYIATDLVLVALLALAFVLPVKGGATLYNAVALSVFSGLLAFGLPLLGIDTPPRFVFLLAGLAPVLVILLYRRGQAVQGEGQAKRLVRLVRYPLAAGSLVYLVAEAVLGPENFWFQAFGVTGYYGIIALVGFIFIDILRAELVSAVEYYEDSVDSLFELFTATGSVIKAGFSLQEVLDGLINVAVEKTRADGGIVLLAEELEEVVAVRAMQGRFPPPFKLPDSLPKDEERVVTHLRHARFRLGEGIFGQVAMEGGALFVPDTDADPTIAKNGDDEWLRLRSLMIAPLVWKDETIGLVAVARIGEEPFSERDFDRLKLLGSFGAISVSDAFTFLEAAERSDIDREAAIAEEIQRTVVPRKLPEVPGLSLAVFMSPAHGVCSDYYDLIRMRGDRALVVFGDVAGKGVSAGLVMVMVRSILHLIVNTTKDAATLLSWVNRGLCGKVDMDHFSTLGLVLIDGGTGELEYANAAHQPLLIYRKETGTVETVDIKSIPIGVERTTEYVSRSLRVKEGDVLLMYSDGVVEAMDEQGRQYGRKNLGAALLRSKDLAAKEIVETIRAEVERHSAKARRHDDQTVLVMKANNR